MDLLCKILGLAQPDGAELLDESIKEGICRKPLPNEIPEGDIYDGLELMGQTSKSDFTDGREMMDQLLKPDTNEREDLLDEMIELDIIEGLGLLLRTQSGENEADLLDEIKDD